MVVSARLAHIRQLIRDGYDARITVSRPTQDRCKTRVIIDRSRRFQVCNEVLLAILDSLQAACDSQVSWDHGHAHSSGVTVIDIYYKQDIKQDYSAEGLDGPGSSGDCGDEKRQDYELRHGRHRRDSETDQGVGGGQGFEGVRGWLPAEGTAQWQQHIDEQIAALEEELELVNPLRSCLKGARKKARTDSEHCTVSEGCLGAEGVRKRVPAECIAQRQQQMTPDEQIAALEQELERELAIARMASAPIMTSPGDDNVSEDDHRLRRRREMKEQMLPSGGNVVEPG
eukprot:TRINITY_DN40933_c0_g1_i1.p1 TRINITY_DN40933_c0_g1~~TRINITY_DN40933_c0_g1_i1.p1  ORF type:complete len:285 (-),score=29.53 TRINITY_DN40933_c0_g1_i1:52-906(-)